MAPSPSPECAAPEFAPAKVNLFLHVTGRRADGYHLLDSLAVFPAVGDTLAWAPSKEFTLEVSGPFGQGLSGEVDNLVLRAGRALAEAAGLRPSGRLTLEKHLPVASGIGGGSADAAAALRLLSWSWQVALPRADLHALALNIGADVPVCLDCRPARMTGIGDTLDAVPPLPPGGIVLVNPGMGVATQAVFRARVGPFSNPVALATSGWPDMTAMTRDLGGFHNDLEAPAVALCPSIAGVLDALRAAPECLLARMSGSGATCFALCHDARSARVLAGAIRRPGWWCWGGSLQGG